MVNKGVKLPAARTSTELDQSLFDTEIKLRIENDMVETKISMPKIFKNPRYRGKHVILVSGKVFTAKTGEGAAEILKKLEKEHPDAVPEVAYIPKARTLIL